MKNLRESLLDDIDKVSDSIDPRDLMIKEWMEEHLRIGKYKINEDGTVNLISNPHYNICSIRFDEEELPDYIVINECRKLRVIAENLSSFKGFPREMGGLILNGGSLVGEPNKKLKTLKDMPQVTSELDLSGLEALTSLEGCPEKLTGDFKCMGCKSLTSLKGAPTSLSASSTFNCAKCPNLKELDIEFKSPIWSFSCSMCKNLEKLNIAIGCEEFSAKGCNKLKNLEGFNPCYHRGGWYKAVKKVYLDNCKNLESIADFDMSGLRLDDPKYSRPKYYVKGCTKLKDIPEGFEIIYK